MNNVFISADDEMPLPFEIEKVRNFALKVLERIDHDNWDLSIHFCNNETIKKLNQEYRGKDEATDVLSFELGETFLDDNGDERILPGDIIISLDTLKENAEYFVVPIDEELKRLIVHGILHLDGLDHATNEKEEPMLEIQESLLENFHEEAIFSAATLSSKASNV
ncbi:MAG: rRNA maturation RNase YbeY [Treponema sp.]|jgi:probable rRNA maturation factor|nr:rRNA maturation RNase YbeY [Treponema sp.]